MTFLELLLGDEAVGDAADLQEALEVFRELKPDDSSWLELCADPATVPTIRRYSSFEAFLDNADALETIQLGADQLAAADAADA
ncbi:MAG: hypothetical protein ACKN83_09520 [Vulcanococcus sp.]